MTAYTTIYHVAPADWDGGDIESLHCQHGDDAYDMYVERWPEAAGLQFEHAHFVHCYSDLADAQDHADEFGGVVLTLDAAAMEEDGIEIETDRIEFPHPIVRDVIHSEYIIG